MHHVTPQHAVTGSGTAKQRETKPACTDAEIQRAITRADAALGAAGHQVTDEETRELGRQVAAGTVSGDEAAARIIVRLRNPPSRLNVQRQSSLRLEVRLLTLAARRSVTAWSPGKLTG